MNRPLKILSLGFRGLPQQQIWKAILAEKEFAPDVVLLPELWCGDEFPMEQSGQVLEAAGRVAAEMNSWLLCPLYSTPDGARRLNTAFLLGRTGQLVAQYDKLFPYWEEFDHTPPCTAGDRHVVVDTDFGRVGLAICFDVNFSAMWQALDDAGAEIVFWPSDYSAGRLLGARAAVHHYYIASATRYPDAAIFDITGEEIAYAQGEGLVTARQTIDLDRCIFHENFNMDKCEKLLRKYPDIHVEQHLLREQWFVLASQSPAVSARAAAKEFGMEELRDYIRRSGTAINNEFYR